MTAILKLYPVSIVAFLVLGAMWPGVVAGSFSRVKPGELLRLDPRRAAGWPGVA